MYVNCSNPVSGSIVSDHGIASAPSSASRWLRSAVSRSLLLLLPGHVEEDPLEPPWTALRVPLHHAAGVEQPDHLAVGADHPVADRPGVARLPGVAAVLGDALAIVGVDHLEPHHRVLDPVFDGIANQIGGLGAEVRDVEPRVGVRSLVDEVERVGDDGSALGEGPEPVLGRLGLPLRLLASGDVQHHPLERAGVAGVVRVISVAWSSTQTTLPSLARNRYSIRNGAPVCALRSTASATLAWSCGWTRSHGSQPVGLVAEDLPDPRAHVAEVTRCAPGWMSQT